MEVDVLRARTRTRAVISHRTRVGEQAKGRLTSTTWCAILPLFCGSRHMSEFVSPSKHRPLTIHTAADAKDERTTDLQDVVVLDALRNRNLLERCEDLTEVLVGNVVELGGVVCTESTSLVSQGEVESVGQGRTLGDDEGVALRERSDVEEGVAAEGEAGQGAQTGRWRRKAERTWHPSRSA